MAAQIAGSKETPKGPAKGPRAGAVPYRVLIVDDSTNSRALLRTALGRLGLRVVGEAASSEEGIGLAEGLRPDLILLAVGLPGLDGLSAAARIMQSAPTPIILLTRHRDRETIRRAGEAGVMAYLLKPLREEELMPAVELAVSRFREFAALRADNQSLRRALEARKVIERAKGILMRQEGIPEAEAFRRIQRRSMDTQIPMVEIAQAILLAEGLRA